MMTKYIENPEYNFEKVNRASQACGPMVKWAIAQVSHLMLEMMHVSDVLLIPVTATGIANLWLSLNKFFLFF